MSGCQARAKISLAKVLQTAGEQRSQASHLELAARHLSDAIEVFENESLANEKSEAVILLADVFNELGFIQGDAGHQEDAVRAYQAVLGSDKASIDGDERSILGNKLGVALARLGKQTQNVELRTLSIETLNKALSTSDAGLQSSLSSNYLPRAYATLAEALVAEASNSASKHDAIGAYEKAVSLRHLDPGYPELQKINGTLQALKADLGLDLEQEKVEVSEQHHDQSEGPQPESTPAAARNENHYLSKLRETLRKAHAKQSSRSGNRGSSNKLSA